MGSMVGYKHYWRTTFALTYIAVGSLAFFLPTQDWYEIIVRVVFILLGLSFFTTFNNPKRGLRLTIAGVMLIVFWLLFATTVIVTNWSDPYYRIHLFYMPLWLLFAAVHYRAIRELNNGQ